MREPSDSSAEFQQLLDDAGIRHVVIGALAALRYRREPRLTTDVDFLLAHAEGLVDALHAAGYDQLDIVGDPPYAIFIRTDTVKVDLLVAETDYQHEALARAVDGYLSPEDVLVHKLIAWRPRDRDDIASILDAEVPIDEGYVSRWAAEWDVTDRWDQARRRRG